MRILSHVDLEGPVGRSGIGVAADHHRKAARLAGATVVTDGVTLDRIHQTVSGASPDVDAVHTHLYGPASFTLAAYARRTNIPLICHAHVTREDFRQSFRGSDQVAKPLGAFLKRWYSLADLVLCPSSYTRRLLEGYPVRAPIEVISNGVDVEGLAGYGDLRVEYRNRYDLEGTVVFSMGRVFERKGLSTFCRVAQELPELEFVWFGPYSTGPLASRSVRRWVRDPPANVTFTGWVPDKRGAFGAGDIFFAPTREENQGIAVLEAMACGKPVVVRNLPVVQEYATDGVDCLQADAAAGFRRAIDRIRTDPSLADELGATARETAQAHRLSQVGEELVEHYRRAITGVGGCAR